MKINIIYALYVMEFSLYFFYFNWGFKAMKSKIKPVLFV